MSCASLSSFHFPLESATPPLPVCVSLSLLSRDFLGLNNHVFLPHSPTINGSPGLENSFRFGAGQNKPELGKSSHVGHPVGRSGNW